MTALLPPKAEVRPTAEKIISDAVACILHHPEDIRLFSFESSPAEDGGVRMILDIVTCEFPGAAGVMSEDRS